MSMKGKPNTAQFKPPKDPTAFLEGGEADKAEKPLVAPAAVTTPPAATPPARAQSTVEQQAGLPPYPADRWDKALGNWKANVASGTKPADILAMLRTKYTLTAKQVAAIEALAQPAQ